MREHLIVQGEVVGGNDIDTSILLNLPVGESQSLGLSKQLLLRNLAAPVCTLPTLVSIVDLFAFVVFKVMGLGPLHVCRKVAGVDSQASVAFFRSRLTPIRGKPRMADLTIVLDFGRNDPKGGDDDQL